MTTVYFVRHAQPNYQNHDDLTRELTAKGMADRTLVTAYLWDKSIDALYSSPYRRSVDTLEDFARQKGLEITMIPDFCERKVGDGWIEDFDAFAERQWADFDYKLPEGESLKETQRRNIAALTALLTRHQGQSIAIGSHGTALSTVIRYYNPDFGYQDFQRIKGLMPWIVAFHFEGSDCKGITYLDL